MVKGSADSRVVGRILIAHVLGLFCVGLWATIRSSAGFSVFGGLFLAFLGGLLSAPLILPALLFGGHFAAQIEQRPLWFATGGPIVIGALVTLLLGHQAGLPVAISAGISSFFFLLMTEFRKWRDRLGGDGLSD